MFICCYFCATALATNNEGFIAVEMLMNSVEFPLESLLRIVQFQAYFNFIPYIAVDWTESFNLSIGTY